jgi:hypothetical protein
MTKTLIAAPGPCARVVGQQPCGHLRIGHCLGVDAEDRDTRCLTRGCGCPGYQPGNDSATRDHEPGGR